MINKEVANWGNYPKIKANLKTPLIKDELENWLKENQQQNEPLVVIARGNGRCYGDSALQKNIFQMTSSNRFIDFDGKSGVLTTESGVLLSDILDTFVPRGWFLSTTPGTKYITVGGAIASDVHGKNHHVDGSFSHHLLNLQVMVESGEIVNCSRDENEDLFFATCGGMGLTGVILRASFKLQRIESAYINQEIVQAPNLKKLMEVIDSSNDWRYTVAWIDCISKGSKMGRGILMRGEHASLQDLPDKLRKEPLVLPGQFKLDVPIYLPSFVLNKWSVKTFNSLYYNRLRRPLIKNMVGYDSFFYPLDNIDNWNRMYGKRGFTQYQCVFPLETSYEGMENILRKITSSGRGSFLAVLKRFGHQDDILSFPMEGYTLALDFALTKGIFNFLNELDEIVLKYRGRLYLTKDVRMSRDMFRDTYANISAFTEIVRKYNPKCRFRSMQSERLGLCI